jgi:TetR/AcrR family transcriptional regulator, transcriptional repressor for nem operon
MPRTIGFDTNTVLAQITDLFWSQGYFNTSTDDIMKATKLSKSSLYNTFGDKRSLFILVLTDYLVSAQLLYKTMLTKKGSTLDIIHELLSHMVEHNTTLNCYKGCFLLNTVVELAPHDKEISEIISNNRQYIIGLFVNLIERGKHNGELRTDINSDAIANFIFSLVNGIKADGKLTNDSKVFAKTIQITNELLESYNIN